MGLLGTSGSGKSTLLNLIGGLDHATEGSLRIFDQDLAQMSRMELSLHRRRNVGIIFQSFNLVSTHDRGRERFAGDDVRRCAACRARGARRRHSSNRWASADASSTGHESSLGVSSSVSPSRGRCRTGRTCSSPTSQPGTWTADVARNHDAPERAERAGRQDDHHGHARPVARQPVRPSHRHDAGWRHRRRHDGGAGMTFRDTLDLRCATSARRSCALRSPRWACRSGLHRWPGWCRSASVSRTSSSAASPGRACSTRSMSCPDRCRSPSVPAGAAAGRSRSAVAVRAPAARRARRRSRVKELNEEILERTGGAAAGPRGLPEPACARRSEASAGYYGECRRRRRSDRRARRRGLPGHCPRTFLRGRRRERVHAEPRLREAHRRGEPGRAGRPGAGHRLPVNGAGVRPASARRCSASRPSARLSASSSARPVRSPPAARSRA